MFDVFYTLTDKESLVVTILLAQLVVTVLK